MDCKVFMIAAIFGKPYSILLGFSEDMSYPVLQVDNINYIFLKIINSIYPAKFA